MDEYLSLMSELKLVSENMPVDEDAPPEVPRESIRTIDEIRALRIERGVSNMPIG